MSWYLKLIQSQLEQEWWRNAQTHMNRVVETQLNPFPRNDWPYNGSEIVYLPRQEQSTVGVESWRSNLDLRFTAFRQSKIYECHGLLQFDKNISEALTYDKHSPQIYRTDRVTGLSAINADLIEVSCSVKRRRLREAVESAKELGPIKLSQEEFTPYHILETIKTLILSDLDDGSEDEVNDPTPTRDSFAPVSSPEINSPQLQPV